MQHPNTIRRDKQKKESWAQERTTGCGPAPVQTQRHLLTTAGPELTSQPRLSFSHPSPLPFAAASLLFCIRKSILPPTPVCRDPVLSPGGSTWTPQWDAPFRAVLDGRFSLQGTEGQTGTGEDALPGAGLSAEAGLI